MFDEIKRELRRLEQPVSFKGGPVAMVLPPSAAESLRQDLTCDACNCRYSTIGAGFFCPACGHNSPLKDVEGTIHMARKTIEALPALSEAVGKLYDPDIAANFEQQLLEDQLENLVTAFQRGTESLFNRLPNLPTPKRDSNLFQRVTDASVLWKSTASVGYDDILDSQDMEFLRIMVSRRHKIGHCQGIVDAKYVQQSGDSAYEVGQRLVSRTQHVLRLAAVLESLINGLKALLVSDRNRPPSTSLTSNLSEKQADSSVLCGWSDLRADLSLEVGPVCKPISRLECLQLTCGIQARADDGE